MVWLCWLCQWWHVYAVHLQRHFWVKLPETEVGFVFLLYISASLCTKNGRGTVRRKWIYAWFYKHVIYLLLLHPSNESLNMDSQSCKRLCFPDLWPRQLCSLDRKVVMWTLQCMQSSTRKLLFNFIAIVGFRRDTVLEPLYYWQRVHREMTQRLQHRERPSQSTLWKWSEVEYTLLWRRREFGVWQCSSVQSKITCVSE